MPSHEFPPFYRPDSRILILGSFPSVKSREESFYYAHPQNRFWRVIAACAGMTAPATLAQKQELLSCTGIALWDVIESCDIRGSSDSSIKNALPTDIAGILGRTDIRKIILNGKTAERCFLRFQTGISLPYAALPSTSPANASWSLERLISVWQKELDLNIEEVFT